PQTFPGAAAVPEFHRQGGSGGPRGANQFHGEFVRHIHQVKQHTVALLERGRVFNQQSGESFETWISHGSGTAKRTRRSDLAARPTARRISERARRTHRAARWTLRSARGAPGWS